MNLPDLNADSDASADVDRFFASEVAALTSTLVELERQIDPAAPAQAHDVNHRRILEAFESSQVACRSFEQEHLDQPELIKKAQARFLAETDPWFSQSWIAQRARTKPHGFVGDYEMLIKLYDEATPARGLGAYLDLCILDLPLARAVRTRLASARAFLLQEISQRPATTRILDVASGPCREFRDWPAFHDRTVEVVAMDTDPFALEFVKTNVCSALPAGTSLAPVRYNALRTTSADNTIRQFGKFDLIYSVGLCDYLTDEQLIRMLAAWRAALTENGVMYVAFKDCDQYDHTPYQWHLDWFFYQRTRADVLRLFEMAGFDVGAMEMTQDATGIITHYLYRAPSDAQRRIDSAEAHRPASENVASRAGVPSQE